MRDEVQKDFGRYRVHYESTALKDETNVAPLKVPNSTSCPFVARYRCPLFVLVSQKEEERHRTDRVEAAEENSYQELKVVGTVEKAQTSIAN